MRSRNGFDTGSEIEPAIGAALDPANWRRVVSRGAPCYHAPLGVVRPRASLGESRDTMSRARRAGHVRETRAASSDGRVILAHRQRARRAAHRDRHSRRTGGNGIVRSPPVASSTARLDGGAGANVDHRDAGDAPSRADMKSIAMFHRPYAARPNRPAG
jgi:hypothetical protein